MADNNLLQQVSLYATGELAYLQNQNAWLAMSNMKYENFQNMTGSLGTTVNIQIPSRFTAQDGLMAVFQAYEQLKQPLTVNHSGNSSVNFTQLEMIYNDIDGFMGQIGEGLATQLGAKIEVYQSEIGAFTPYRFFSNGTTTIGQINSVTQLAAAKSRFDAYAMGQKMWCVLPNIDSANIVGTALAQFVPARNEKMANSWAIGSYTNVDWVQSTIIPTHQSGSAGEAGDTLTVQAISADGTQITLSGASSDVDTVLKNDLFQFTTALYYVNYRTYQRTPLRAQFKATASANASAGTVVVNIDPPLIATVGVNNQSINRAIAIGTDTCVALPSHRRTLMCSDNSLFLAMPKLPDLNPWATAAKVDKETGASCRLRYGSGLMNPDTGFILDAIWEGVGIAPYQMAMIWPLEPSIPS